MRALPLLFLVLLVACVGRARQTGPGRDVLTAEEIASVPATNIYDVVRRLRPQWLRQRSSGTPSDPVPVRPMVYVDGVPQGRVGVLRDYRREGVIRMEFLGPSDATNRFGTGHSGGAILVTTGRNEAVPGR